MHYALLLGFTDYTVKKVYDLKIYAHCSFIKRSFNWLRQRAGDKTFFVHELVTVFWGKMTSMLIKTSLSLTLFDAVAIVT